MPPRNPADSPWSRPRGKQAPKGKPRPRAPKPAAKPPLRIQPTTLWDYPSQHYGNEEQGSKHYIGATPSYVIWNVIQRYTRETATILDPFCGSGTTLDVCRDTGRTGVGFDLQPQRDDIARGDARDLPLDDVSVDCVFMDPPYSTHVDYGDDPACIGKTNAGDLSEDGYYHQMDAVFAEVDRVLKPGGYAATYVGDSYEKGTGPTKGFHPIGLELFALMANRFEPIDHIVVTRHNKQLSMGNHRMAAEDGNFYLRGFHHLMIFWKPGPDAARLHGRHLPGAASEDKPAKPDQRNPRRPRGVKTRRSPR